MRIGASFLVLAALLAQACDSRNAAPLASSSQVGDLELQLLDLADHLGASGLLLAEIDERTASREVVQAVGDSGDATLRPILRQLIDRIESPADNDRFSFCFFHALWMLGEPDEFFETFFSTHYRTRPVLARSALHVAGYGGGSDGFSRELSMAVGSAEVPLYIRVAAQEYERVRSLEMELAAVEAAGDRVAFLLRLTPWSEMEPAAAWNPYGNQLPYRVWARARLAEVSRSHPKETARALLDCDPFAGGELHPGPAKLDEVRAKMRTNLTPFLAPACVDALEEG
ncbi:MAG: hypothetical protein AAF682_14700 [Planctomycetota bacterium]